jgi:uncharacterized membrane protein
MNPKRTEAYDKDGQPISNDEISTIRRRALLNLMAMPVYLLMFGCLGFTLWQTAMKLVTAQEPKSKLLFGVVALILILIEIALSYFVIRFTRWALPRKSTKTSESDQGRNPNPKKDEP